jgi:predicted ArsR family transcriptional regulator
MITTKTQILALLKRNGGRTVSGLADALHLATITIRQHLTHLERDGLVVRSPDGKNGGRPTHVFQLTAKGNTASFPRRTDRLVELLVTEVSQLEGSELVGLGSQEKTKLVLQRLALRLADEYRPFMERWPLEERVAFVTEVMHADGGFAEWEMLAGGYEIRDFNCLFRKLLEGDETGCDWHRTFLARSLGADVRLIPCPPDSPICCRYFVATSGETVAAQPAIMASAGGP